MTLTQIIHLIAMSKKVKLKQYRDNVKDMLVNIDGSDSECILSLFTSDKHLVYVEFVDSAFIGSRSKYVG